MLLILIFILIIVFFIVSIHFEMKNNKICSKIFNYATIISFVLLLTFIFIDFFGLCKKTYRPVMENKIVSINDSINKSSSYVYSNNVEVMVAIEYKDHKEIKSFPMESVIIKETNNTTPKLIEEKSFYESSFLELMYSNLPKENRRVRYVIYIPEGGLLSQYNLDLN